MNILNKLWGIFEKIIGTAAKGFFKILGKELTDEQLKSFIQFVKFCLVGLSNTAISFGVYYIFLFIDTRLYIVGNAAGFIISVLNSYFWNSRFVFNKRDEKGRTIIKTFAAYSTNLILGTLLLYFLVDIIGISEYVAPFINLIITVPINYLLNKKWVMK